jgi:hypothetical protein
MDTEQALKVDILLELLPYSLLDEVESEERLCPAHRVVQS